MSKNDDPTPMTMTMPNLQVVFAFFKKPLGWFIGLALLVLLIFGGMSGDGEASIVQFFWRQITYGVQVLMILAVALMAVYISQLIRSFKWFDRRGAAREMEIVQGRIGTSKEKANDAPAVAFQYLATTILIAVVLLSFFLVQRATVVATTG